MGDWTQGKNVIVALGPINVEKIRAVIPTVNLSFTHSVLTTIHAARNARYSVFLAFYLFWQTSYVTHHVTLAIARNLC